jgi:hypothetical protein
MEAFLRWRGGWAPRGVMDRNMSEMSNQPAEEFKESCWDVGHEGVVVDERQPWRGRVAVEELW